MTLDLHVHSHHSDGTWSPTALVQHAISLNLKHLALTDHDTVAGVSEAIEAAAGRIEIIPAVEVNTVYENQSGGREDIHILGYFVDINNAQLAAVLSKQQAAREQHIFDSIDAVRKIGIDISSESIRAYAGVGSIGRAHITLAIVEAGGAADLTSAYERFMSRTSPHYVHRKSISPAEAIAAINAAGGIASIAHPGKEAHIDELILHLRDSGLRAIEAFHRIHSLSRIRHYMRLAHRNGMLITGGSDCHGPFEDYAPTMGSIKVPLEVLPELKKTASA